MKHTLILEQVLKSLIEDKSVDGLLLMGSVACGCATANSDLDLLILSDHNEFKKEIREGIIVEYIYMTEDKAKEKLEKSNMEVYHYLDSQVLYDNGSINELIDIAKKKYASYITPKEEKQSISNWIFSTRLKLKSAIEIHDNLKISYIIATNAWKVLEAVWALNNKPMPPSSSAFRMVKQLKVVPNDVWFESIFLGDTIDKAIAMLKIIDWALPLLDE